MVTVKRVGEHTIIRLLSQQEIGRQLLSEV
jgi:hypothetical protein